jgi:hypothetical protein
MKFICVVLLAASALTACDGSSIDNDKNEVVDGVRPDGSCTPELVNLYNKFSKTHALYPFPESQEMEYEQNLERYDLCEKLKVNVNKGTTCGVQDGHLAFASLRPSCAYASEVKAAAECEKDFFNIYTYMETQKFRIDVMRLINLEGGLASDIKTTAEAMNDRCNSFEYSDYPNVCLNKNYTRTIGHHGPTFGYVVGLKDLREACNYAQELLN